MKIKALLLEGKKKVDRELDLFLPRKGELAKAMRYAVFAGGKRFRPILCLSAAKTLGCPEKKVLPFACAVEMAHTFTLIHDDLPAMDNSDLRRGKRTCHKVFGEDRAILAGDALNTLAFKIIAEYPRAVAELSQGLLDVVEGQVLDLASEGKKLSLKQAELIHHLKTGGLLRACVRGAAFIGGAAPKEISALTDYANHLGLAFQIADDILDATSTLEHLGKPVKADINKGFPYIVGLEKSKKMANEEMEKACLALSFFDKQAAVLRQLAEFVVYRNI